jgi:hypothetical protein
MFIARIPSASQTFARNPREERLMIVMSQLTQGQQDTLRMRYVENLPSKEIADKLGKSERSDPVTRELNILSNIAFFNQIKSPPDHRGFRCQNSVIVSGDSSSCDGRWPKISGPMVPITSSRTWDGISDGVRTTRSSNVERQWVRIRSRFECGTTRIGGRVKFNGFFSLRISSKNIVRRLESDVWSSG